MLKIAYASELSGFRYFWYVSQTIEVIGNTTPRILKTEQTKRLGMQKRSTLRAALEKALEFERPVIKYYNDLANSTKDKDHGTYKLALELLDAEREDEQNIEDILAKLEIQ